MAVSRIREYLDSHNVKYAVLSHSPAYTAQEVAASAHESGYYVAKTVIVKLDGELAAAVVPAVRQVSFEKLKALTGAEKVELATEAEMEERFPDCEVGAMPPFGNLYDTRVLVDEELTRDRHVSFEAGTHKEMIRMKYSDFKRLVQPEVGRFTTAG